MSRDVTFIEALQSELDRREPTESPFASPPAPRADPLPPGAFPTPHADAVLNPKIVERFAREREAYLRRINPGGAGAAEYEFRYDVFAVHRPPGSCFECKLKTSEVFKLRQEAIEAGGDPRDVEPDFDFHTCPHHRRAEYVALMNRAHRKEVVLASHREETLQSGVVQCCVSWGEPVRPARPAAAPAGDQNAPARKPPTL